MSGNLVEKTAIEDSDAATDSPEKSHTAGIRRATSLGSYFLILLSALLGLYYYMGVWRATYNFPTADDFDVFLSAATKIRSNPDLLNKFLAFFTHHNEHIPVLSRVAGVAMLALHGSINFKILAFLGATSVALMVLLLCFVLRREGRPVYGSDILVLALLFFQPQYASVSVWATTAWLFIWVYIFSLLAFWFAESSGLRASWGREALALVCATAAFFTMGSGAVTFVVLAGYYLGKKRYFAAARAAVLCAILLAFWMTGAEKSMAAPTIQPGLIIRSTLELLGSSLGFFRLKLALLTGAGICAGFALAFWRRSRLSPVLLMGMAFTILSAAACVLGRTDLVMEGFSVTTPRYTFLSVFALAMLYLSIAGILSGGRRTEFAVFALVTGSGFNLWAQSAMEYVPLQRYHTARISAERWQLFQAGLYHPDPPQAARVMKKAEALGVVKPQEIEPQYAALEPVDEQLGKREFKTGQDLDIRVEDYHKNLEALSVSGWVFLKGHQGQQIEVRLIVRDGEKTYAAKAFQFRRRDVLVHAWRKFGEKQPAATAFSILAPIRDLPIKEGSVFLSVQVDGANASWHGVQDLYELIAKNRVRL